LTRQSKILLVLGVSTVVVVVCFVAIQMYLNSMTKVNLTDEQVHQILTRALPPGTSKAVVRGFLNDKKWAFSEDGSTIQTTIGDARHDFLIRTDIQVQFHFHSEDKLLSYSLKDLYKGP
jgi:hypothetical protein